MILAKEKLGIVNNPKIQFWTSFIKCFPTKKFRKDKITDEALLIELKKIFPELNNIISNIFEQINYENYNEEDSLRLIIELLNNSQLSLTDFNTYVYPTIDISELYYLDFKRINESKKLKFKQSLYSQFINSDKDKRQFLNCLYQYDSLKGKFQNEINYDVEVDLLSQLLEQFNIELSIEYQFSFEEIFASNKKTFEAKAEEQNISKELANQFINDNIELESLLYFETEIEALIEQLKNWIPKIKEDTGSRVELAKKRVAIGDSDFLFNDFSDLFNQLESSETFQTTLSKITIKNVGNGTSSTGKKRRSHSKNSAQSKQLTENIGFLGEWLVYKHLLNSVKNRESIKWVSEYAKLAGVNADGKNGWGYDLEYIPNDAKYPRYAEVKVVGSENAFHISSNEILQGEKLKKHYEIFLVRNIGQHDHISIEIIQGPFNYKGQKTFNDNELFTVVNDSFILKFEKTDD